MSVSVLVSGGISCLTGVSGVSVFGGVSGSVVGGADISGATGSVKGEDEESSDSEGRGNWSRS